MTRLTICGAGREMVIGSSPGTQLRPAIENVVLPSLPTLMVAGLGPPLMSNPPGHAAASAGDPASIGIRGGRPAQSTVAENAPRRFSWAVAGVTSHLGVPGSLPCDTPPSRTSALAISLAAIAVLTSPMAVAGWP